MKIEPGMILKVRKKESFSTDDDERFDSLVVIKVSPSTIPVMQGVLVYSVCSGTYKRFFMRNYEK